jgi:hypothetical protein
MNTIIIDGRRELAELPEKWYADGTKEANEWGKAMRKELAPNWRFIAPSDFGATGHDLEAYCKGTYITPSEFLRLVYKPWKEGQKVKLPMDYNGLCSLLNKKKMPIIGHTDYFPKHIQACAKLTNIMNFANDAFEGDGDTWEVYEDGDIVEAEYIIHPVRFTAKAAAKWACKTFPEIFKAYWNVNN